MTTILRPGDYVVALLPNGQDDGKPHEVRIEPGRAGGFGVSGTMRVWWLHDEGKKWRRWEGVRELGRAKDLG